MIERFPQRGLSGYVAALTIQVEHGKGEVALPQGFQVQTGSEAARVLTDAGFLLPDPSGTGAPSIVASGGGGADAGAAVAHTDVTIPFLLLPKTPGRHAMTLPPVPIAIARASGEVLTLCTRPHTIVVDDPTASVPDAKPRPNPPPRLQRETWVLARQIVLGALGGAALAALAAWLIVRWMRRPKPVPPPPPPRPPWVVAFEELRAIRFADLIAQGRLPEHFDRVSDALRKYLGGRYGFDGLETTTYEMQSKLRSVSPPPPELGAIFTLLDTCDLVKFARFSPSDEDGKLALDEAERIVHATMPASTPPEVAA